MKKIFLTIACCLSFVMTNAQKKSETTILTGKITTADLENYSWFKTNYENYNPKSNVLNELKKFSGFSITIFFGTWCEDSHNTIPALLKTLDQMGYDKSKISLVALDKNKKSNQEFEKGLSIFKLPTIIISKKDDDSNRIVESPIETIEEDLLKIFSGKNYNHKYAQ